MKAYDPELGYVPCGKKHDGGFIPCPKPEGHEREELRQARASGPHQPLRRRIVEESPKQRERTSFLHGIKAERLHQMAARPADDGRPFGCEGSCGRRYRTFEEAWADLTVSHVVPRNDSSTRYERRLEPDFRGDNPANILVECVSCNRQREPQPEWGES